MDLELGMATGDALSISLFFFFLKKGVNTIISSAYKKNKK
jgi:hypothetical protein